MFERVINGLAGYVKLKLYIKAKRNVEQRKHLKNKVFWVLTSRQKQHAVDVNLYIDPLLQSEHPPGNVCHRV
jgi:5-carboxymethyl-2-hydroxymuconate isomerase